MWDFLNKLFDLFCLQWQKQFAELQANQQQFKELIMGIKEDFAAFKTDVDAKLDELNNSLVEINKDITDLLAANANTPPEVVQGMQDVQAKLQALVDAAKADAALNDGGSTPPDNPPL